MILRRKFTAGLFSLVGSPLFARAQSPAMPVIGFLSSRTASDSATVERAWRQGLREAGYVEGHNVHIAFRWADGQFARLPELAADLVNQRVGVIVAAGGDVTALAAKSSSQTIPIVFIVGSDPARSGIVASLNRPGGNLTGVTIFTAALSAKRLELLRELVPNPGLIAVLLNPKQPGIDRYRSDIVGAAATLKQQILIVEASNESEIDPAIAEAIKEKPSALIVLSDPFLNTRRDHIIKLAERNAVPAMYDSREHSTAGGLISYGASYTDIYHQGGVYTGKVLKGAKPHELPILQPRKFELIINLKTAKALGLTIPPKLLFTADEVIE
jgi:putative ABC transport system substrate-binding protein